MIVVCDSTVLIGLSRIGKLELLRDLFGQVSLVRFSQKWQERE